MTPHSRLVWTNGESDGGVTVTTVTFSEIDGRTQVAIHDLYPTKEALDDATGSTGAMPEALDQLDELLATSGSTTTYEHAMGILTFSLNVTLDGCIDRREGIADDETRAFFAAPPAIRDWAVKQEAKAKYVRPVALTLGHQPASVPHAAPRLVRCE